MRYSKQQILSVAREIFTDNSQASLRGRAFVEIWHIIGNKNETRNLHWVNIRLEEKAIVFEKLEVVDHPTERYSWGSPKTIDRYVEDRRYELNAEAIAAIIAWSDYLENIYDSYKINNWVKEHVFQDVQYGPPYRWDEEKNTIVGAEPEIRHIYHISHGTMQHIFEACQSELDERERTQTEKRLAEQEAKVIQENPRYAEIEKQLIELEVKRKELEREQQLLLHGNPAAHQGDPLECLDLTVRVFNALRRTDIKTIGDVLDMLDRGPDAIFAIRNFGEKSFCELRDKLKQKGYLSL